MKTKTIAVLAAFSLLPLSGFTQSSPTPPTPPVPPTAPVPPVPPNSHRDHDNRPKVPVTFLGVETSEVPTVVAEQLGLPKGFGLVVDYVVPDGPAAVAGVQANDILKMFNDQILTEPDQLAKLVRSNAEGASVTLTVLRKGAETKLTAKLAKREVPQRRGMERRWKRGENFGDLGPAMEDMQEQMREQMGNMQFGMIGDAVERAREEAERAREQARLSREEVRRAMEEGKRAMAEGRRAAEEGMRAAAREVKVMSMDNGTMKTTRIDLGKAQIVYNDAQGEMKIETVDNKRMLTAKDPQGRLLFSGPISTKEEIDKMPAEVRQRYDKLEQKDLPSVGTNVTVEDNDADDEDDGDEDIDVDQDNDSDSESVDVLQVFDRPVPSFPARRLGINTVLI
jgi:hypothetical protein